MALYLTRGEAGILAARLPPEAAAYIRTSEAQRACAILKARPVFAGQVDGRTEINESRYNEFRALIEAENPDVVLALADRPRTATTGRKLCMVYDASGARWTPF